MAPVVIAAIVIATMLATSAWFSERKRIYDEDRQYHGSANGSEAQAICIKLPWQRELVCASQAEKTSGEPERSDDDLRAQQEMADWAYYVALFSGLGLIVSLGGVGLVYATFHKTAEAVDEARKSNDMLRDEKRPWLIVTDPKFESLTTTTAKVDGELVKDSYCFSAMVSFCVTNSGSMPATNVRILAQMVDRFHAMKPGEVRNLAGPMSTANGLKLYNIGVQRFFEWTKSEAVRFLGEGPFTIGRDASFKYDYPAPQLISIDKQQGVFGNQQRCLVVSVAYNSPGKDERVFSQFAFDICGKHNEYIMFPPVGDLFRSGQGLVLRQAESDVR